MLFAKSLIYVSVIIALVDAAYWYRNYVLKGGVHKKRVFPSNTSCIYDQEIPEIVWESSNCNETCLEKERNSLLNFHMALSGSRWRKKWNLSATNFHCDWFGILCDFKTKRVIAMKLNRNRLQGVLSVDLRGMELLFGLCLGVNSINGNLQHIIPWLPKNFLRLSLAFNQIEGWLPNSLPSHVPLLSKIQLSGNPIQGHLPDSIGDLKSLTVLSVGETKINGSVPTSLSLLKKLWFLDLEALNLDGNFSTFHNLTSLEYMHLSSNRIKGEIPRDMGYRYPNLIELLLQNNLLTGSLPSSIGLLSKLTTLNVARNKLRGEIPARLGGLNLEVIIISSNLFSAFEQGFALNYTNLNIFQASDLSYFSFDVQELITFLLPAVKSLIQVDVSNSNLNGSLPDDIYLFRKATFLKFASNRINGRVPAPDDNLPFLTLLDLSRNNLTGNIPTAFSRLLMLQELDLRDNPLLKGNIDSSFLTTDDSFRINERPTDTCPLIRFAHNHGAVYVNSSYYERKYCQCKEHYYGRGGYCHPCIQGGHCPGFVKTMNETQTGHLDSKLFLKRGVWPFPNENNVTSLQSCPTSIYYLNLCVPDSLCACTVIYDDSVSVRYSTSTKIRSGLEKYRIRCNQECLCASGHAGRFCSQCSQGYYKDGIRCFQCPKEFHKTTFYVTLFGSTLAVLIVSLIIFYVSKKHVRVAVTIAVGEFSLVLALVYKSCLPVFSIKLVIIFFALAFKSYLRKCMGLLKSAMFYIQVMDTLVSMTDIWPKAIFSLESYASGVLNFKFSSLACSFPSLYTVLSRHAILFASPFSLSALIIIVYFCWRSMVGPDPQRAKSFELKCRQYGLIFIDVAYFPMVASSMSVLAGCRKVDNVSFMRSFVWLDCGTTYHYYLKVVAILQLVFYVIGVPMFIYCPLLYRYRHEVANEDSPVTNWLGHLIYPYRPHMRHYVEVIMMARRLLIAVFLALFPANEPVQTQLIVMLLVAAIIFQALARPYARQRKIDEDEEDKLGIENAIDIFMLSAMLLSFTCVGLSIGHKMYSFTSKLFLLTVITNILFVFSFCCAVVYRLFRTTCGKQTDTIPAPFDIQQPLLDATEGGYARMSSQT